MAMTTDDMANSGDPRYRRRMTSVEIVFFDAGDTLIHPEPPVGEAYARAGRRHRLDVAPADLESSFRSAFAEKKRHSIPREQEWWRQIVENTFAPFGTPDDPYALFVELCDHFARPTSWRLYPEAIETITTLRDRGYRTGRREEDDKMKMAQAKAK